MSKEEHNKNAKIENLIWEIAKTLKPSGYIEPEKINKAKKSLMEILNE